MDGRCTALRLGIFFPSNQVISSDFTPLEMHYSNQHTHIPTNTPKTLHTRNEAHTYTHTRVLHTHVHKIWRFGSTHTQITTSPNQSIIANNFRLSHTLVLFARTYLGEIVSSLLECDYLALWTYLWEMSQATHSPIKNYPLNRVCPEELT